MTRSNSEISGVRVVRSTHDVDVYQVNVTRCMCHLKVTRIVDIRQKATRVIIITGHLTLKTSPQVSYATKRGRSRSSCHQYHRQSLTQAYSSQVYCVTVRSRSPGVISNTGTNTHAFATGELRADVGDVGELVVRHLDTSVLESVRAFAKEVLDAEKAIHVLVSAAWCRWWEEVLGKMTRISRESDKEEAGERDHKMRGVHCHLPWHLCSGSVKLVLSVLFISLLCVTSASSSSVWVYLSTDQQRRHSRPEEKASDGR